MDTKEKDLAAMLNLSRDEMKTIRNVIRDKHDLGVLWYREESNKPEHLRTVYWTDAGLVYLKYYMETKKQWNEANEQSKPWTLMTKGQFDKSVKDTQWTGKVVNNNYKNNTCLMVEHETGFKVLTRCRDSRLYPKLSYVVVDSKSLSHTIRLPYFKTYEKAQEQVKRLRQRPA